jgi:hypothetical protein
VAVWVRNAGSTADAYDNALSNGSIAFEIEKPRKSVLLITGLSANRTAPQPAGTTVTFTATASGGAAPYQYKWLLYNGDTWSVLQNWTTSNSYAWTPSTTNAEYRVGVWVRNAGSTADTYDDNATASLLFPIAPMAPGTPLLLTGINADRMSPQASGTSITFTATATGGSGNYQYKWWIFDGVSWTVVQGWSGSRTFTWTPGSASASYRVGLWVRNASSTVDSYDNPASNGSIGFVIQ